MRISDNVLVVAIFLFVYQWILRTKKKSPNRGDYRKRNAVFGILRFLPEEIQYLKHPVVGFSQIHVVLRSRGIVLLVLVYRVEKSVPFLSCGFEFVNEFFVASHSLDHSFHSFIVKR